MVGGGDGMGGGDSGRWSWCEVEIVWEVEIVGSGDGVGCGNGGRWSWWEVEMVRG